MIDEVPQRPASNSATPMLLRRRGDVRRARILLILIVALFISGGAGMLAHAAGNNVPEAVLTAGGAFAGAVGVLLALVHYAGVE
ncbi:hypothetical protein [Actinoplanes sp. N902-109]|uniref:hypothetical protein n=1 Tax=Actinoplanes sp. (strain N902-109) TaxID=649831 RepID=UPI000329505D|nr:hypothetical protein [Actinoplanes sp. N902-109]AGL20799.1 hypothetical protein L083_7289 [Actinoplanes sp. N902-109]